MVKTHGFGIVFLQSSLVQLWSQDLWLMVWLKLKWSSNFSKWCNVWSETIAISNWKWSSNLSQVVHCVKFDPTSYLLLWVLHNIDIKRLLGSARLFNTWLVCLPSLLGSLFSMLFNLHHASACNVHLWCTQPQAPHFNLPLAYSPEVQARIPAHFVLFMLNQDGMD